MLRSGRRREVLRESRKGRDAYMQKSFTLGPIGRGYELMELKVKT